MPNKHFHSDNELNSGAVLFVSLHKSDVLRMFGVHHNTLYLLY